MDQTSLKNSSVSIPTQSWDWRSELQSVEEELISIPKIRQESCGEGFRLILRKCIYHVIEIIRRSTHLLRDPISIVLKIWIDNWRMDHS